MVSNEELQLQIEDLRNQVNDLRSLSNKNEYSNLSIVEKKLQVNSTVSNQSEVLISADGNFLQDVINTNIDTQTKTILKDFTFSPTDYSGAFKTGDITWNTSTGAITGGSGGLFNKNGLVFASAGVATITLDGVTGSATFSGNVTGATITGGIIQTATSGARVVISNANDISLFDDTTGGGGTITGNSAAIKFLRTDDTSQGFQFIKRAGKDYDADNILEMYPLNSGFGRLNYFFGGRDGTGTTSVMTNYYGLTASHETGKATVTNNGKAVIEICRDGVLTDQSPVFVGMDASCLYGNNTYTGTIALVVGSGTYGMSGIGYDVSPGVINVGAGMFNGNATAVTGDTDNLFDIGSSSIRYKTGYFYNLDVVNGDTKSYECGENITSGNSVTLGQYTTGEFRTDRFSDTSYVDMANPTSNYGTETGLKIKTSGAGQQEAYLLFTTGQSGDPELFDKVYLRLYFTSTSATFKLQINRVTSTWDESTITWNNKPTLDTARNWAYEVTTPVSAGFLDVDITELYCMCYQGGETNYGIRIYASSSSGEGDSVTISSSRATSGQAPALLFYGLFNTDKIYKSTNTNNLCYYAWEGFATETKNSGQQCLVNVGEYFTTTSLTTGSEYYLSTAGAIVAGFDGSRTNNFLVGKAVSTTLLKVNKTRCINVFNQRKIGSGDTFGSTTINNARYDVIVSGIPPLEVKMRTILNDYNINQYGGESKIKASNVESGATWSLNDPSTNPETILSSSYSFDFTGMAGKTTDYKIDVITIWNNFIVIKHVKNTLAANSSLLLTTDINN